MGTLAEEILSARVGRTVHAGEIVVVDVDYAMSHDTTSPLAIEAFRKLERPLWDPSRIVIAIDHVVPASTPAVANIQRGIRAFAQDEGIGHFYPGGSGICHQLMVEQGFVAPGAIVVGGDSHTVTYGALGAFATGMGSTDIGLVYATGKTWLRVPETVRFEVSGSFGPGVTAKDLTLLMVRTIGVAGAVYDAVEYGGETVRRLSISERMTLANMSIEMGGKVGLIEADEVTDTYLTGRVRYDTGTGHLRPINPEYRRVVELSVDDLEPLVACPPEVDNVRPVTAVVGTPLDEVFIGTCTNGRLDDLALAARVLEGQTVHPNTRCIIIPASREVQLQALEHGYIDTFIRAGAQVGTPGCGPCIGRHFGVLGKGERALTTMNRNFTGRMGDPTAEIYLGNPATAAASAITGAITDPRPYLG
jgi:3-isopropylmalate/(R)-2-methylmalate dehydratase large subunit/methanogen homoaconitase large subunit